MTLKEAVQKLDAGKEEEGSMAALRAAVIASAKVYVLKVGPVGRRFRARLFVAAHGEIVEITRWCVLAGVPGTMHGSAMVDHAAVVTFNREWARTDVQIAAAAVADVLGYTASVITGEAL